jgi:hypothetical protein
LKPLYKYFLYLILLSLLVISAVLLANKFFATNISITGLVFLSASFLIASAIALLVFFTGQLKEPASQPFYSLAGITLKFLIEMVIALIWFITFKKTSLSYILLFFVLYLAFSLFSIWVILNALKKKSL